MRYRKCLLFILADAEHSCREMYGPTAKLAVPTSAAENAFMQYKIMQEYPNLRDGNFLIGVYLYEVWDDTGTSSSNWYTRKAIMYGHYVKEGM